MRIGILLTSIGDFGKKGYYNAQEVGLGRTLDSLTDEVVIVKAVPQGEAPSQRALEGCAHTTLRLIPAKKLGTSGLLDPGQLDGTLDALVYFSDTQLALPAVHRWCTRNGVRMIPYVGVLESRSLNRVARLAVNLGMRRNIAVYRRCACLAKSAHVLEKLRRAGVENCTLAPVGLDLSLMRQDFAATPVSQLRAKWGFGEGRKILLFVGRMVEEKRPLEMIDLFYDLHGRDRNYALIMVGDGKLYGRAVDAARRRGLKDDVRFIRRVPYADMWELYRISEALINLNRNEIVGMAIMEAMYYGCKVIAVRAPGPNLIIEDKVSGLLVSEISEVCGALREPIAEEESHRRILDSFTWQRAARTILKITEEPR